MGFKDDGKLRIAVVPSAFAGSDDKHIEHLAGAFRLLLERYPEAQVAVAIGNRRSGICRCRDREIAEQFVRSVNHDRRIIPLMNYELSPAQIKGIFGLFDIVVSCRMHMMIFSTMAGTPTVAIATQPKIREFMKLCGQEDRALPLEDLTDRKLLQKIEETLGSSAEIRQDLQEARARLESLVAAAAADYALDALSSRPREISRSESLTCGPLSC